MKKTILFTALATMFLANSFAQTSDAGIALNAFKNAVASKKMDDAKEKIEEAKKYIDKAMQSESDKAKPKTWYYAGQIYTNLMIAAKLSNGEDLMTGLMNVMQAGEKADPKVAEELMNILLKDENYTKGLGYYKQHVDMPKKAKDDYSEEIKAELGQGIMMFIMLGNQALQKDKFELARDAYMRAVSTMEITGTVDYAVYFNAGISAEAVKDWVSAEKAFKACAEKDYEGAMSFGKWAKALANQDKKEEAGKVLDQGRAKHGANKDFAIEEANIYIATGDLAKAEAALQTLIDADPKNPLLQFNVGVIFDNTHQYDKAAEAYKKAIELDPKYFDAHYNLGAMYYNQGVDYFNKIQSIDDMAEFAKEEKKAKEYFQTALPFMEKAHEIDPSEKNTLQILKGIYARLGMNDKYNEVIEKLKN